MKERRGIGKISFEFDEKQLEEIVNAGNLGDFVDKTTELFRQNLKAELVNNVASGSTTFARYNDWEYGTVGPRPPIGPIFYEIDKITNRLKELEIFLKLDRM